MAFASVFRSSIVGLDIGSSGVKAVALRAARGGWSLTAAHDAPIAGDRANADEVDDPGVSAAVRLALEAMPLRRVRVAAALSGHAIVKRLTLPQMSRAELAEAIPWEAEQYVPFDLADVRLDYEVVPAGPDGAKSTLDVLLVAAKKDRIDERAAVIAEAGCQTAIMDVEAFALTNAYRMNYPERQDPLTALLHVGRSTTIACLLEHGQLVFTRDISIGGRLYTDALQRELGVDAPTAERIQRGRMPSEVDREQAAAVLRETTSQLILEIRKTVDFYRTTAPIDALGRIVLSGGAWQAEGLADLLTAEFGATVDVLDPFRRVARASGLDFEGGAPAYAVAVGLAMRREGDR
jgi:type IV pilus assembly protein PilM